MLKNAAAIFISITISALTFFQSVPDASAKDGYRLCAPRKGQCKCQKVGDAPGVWTIMDQARCIPGSRAMEPTEIAKPSPIVGKKGIREIQKLLSQTGYVPGRADGFLGNQTKIAIKDFQRKSGMKADGRPTSSLLSALRKTAPKLDSAKTNPQVKQKTTKASRLLNSRFPFPKLSLEEPKLENCRLVKGQCTCDLSGSERRKQSIVDRNQCKSQQAAKSISTKRKPRKSVSSKTLRVAQERLNLLGYDAGAANGVIQPKTTTAIKEFQETIGLLADGEMSPTLIRRLDEMASEEVSLPIYDKEPVRVPASVIATKPTSPGPSIVTKNPVKTLTRKTRGEKISPKAPATVAPSKKMAARPAAPVPEVPKKESTPSPIITAPKSVASTLPAKPANKTAAAPSAPSLFQFFQPNSKLPDSMDGYKNCALRKGICLCQKRSDGPGVFTTMQHDVCTRRTVSKGANPASAPPKSVIVRKAPIASPKKLRKLRAPTPKITAKKSALSPTTTASLQKATPSSPSFTAENKTTKTPTANGLFGFFKPSTQLPNSMEGYKNCALRKGKCLCQKRGSQPGVFTTMQHEVCTRRTVAPTANLKTTPKNARSSIQKTVPVTKGVRGPKDRALPLVKKTNIGPATTASLKTRKPLAPSSTPVKKTAKTAPIGSLLGFFNTNAKLPNSMDGYRNCALRKGKCLCQKRDEDPGVWTIMRHDVCTRRTGAQSTIGTAGAARSNETTKNKGDTPIGPPVSGLKSTPKAGAKSQAKNSSKFIDSIANVLAPKSGKNN